ncbi:MAG: tRNA epoxyqueuosine(34) reductase QueG [Candidatus Eisenbacteria bacterium]
MSGPAERTTLVKRAAFELGFDEVRIASAGTLAAQAHYERWLADGFHGDMRWLASDEHRARRADPTRLLPGLESVVCVLLGHPPERDTARDDRLGHIARYAAGEDYHRIMRERMAPLEDHIRSLHPGSRALWYSDTGAILERGWAERAGLGWVGKHSGLLSPTRGSWFLLGQVLVDYPLVPDAPLEREHCGTCVRCLEACPTGAIVAPYQVDARRCISYLTIEHPGPIPRDLRALIGDWVFGCDVCQEVCPWNRFAPPARKSRLHARELEGWSLERFLGLDELEFASLFAQSPIRRAGRAGFLRNVCVALGNRAETAAAAALAQVLSHDPDGLVRAHAAWALGEIGARHGARAPAHDGLTLAEVLTAAARDADATVAEEARAALVRAGG